MHEIEAAAAPSHATRKSEAEAAASLAVHQSEAEAPGDDTSDADKHSLLWDLLECHRGLDERMMSLLLIIERRLERIEAIIEATQRARTSEWFQRLGSTQPTDRPM
jgi:hypothetical protein